MQRIFLFLLVFLLVMQAESGFGQKQKKPSISDQLGHIPEIWVNDNVIMPYMRQVYRKDAVCLSQRALAEEIPVHNQTIKVPEELVVTIYNCLLSVRISDFPAADSIARYYIRARQEPSNETIVISFKRNLDWMEPIKKREDTTLNTEFNNIIRRYNLVMTRLVDLDESTEALVIQALEPLNMVALKNTIETQCPDIKVIEEIQPWEDGNDISVALTDGGWELTYYLRWEPHISEQDKHYSNKEHYWKFIVNYAGATSYLGSGGDSMLDYLYYGRRIHPDVLKKN